MPDQVGDGGVRGLLFEFVIDTEKQHDVVTRQIVLAECRLQRRGISGEVDDFKSRWNGKLCKDGARRIHRRLVIVAAMHHQRRAVAGKLKSDEPVIYGDVRARLRLPRNGANHVIRRGDRGRNRLARAGWPNLGTRALLRPIPVFHHASPRRHARCDRIPNRSPMVWSRPHSNTQIGEGGTAASESIFMLDLQPIYI